jgi:hypothetical protein
MPLPTSPTAFQNFPFALWLKLKAPDLAHRAQVELTRFMSLAAFLLLLGGTTAVTSFILLAFRAFFPPQDLFTVCSHCLGYSPQPHLSWLTLADL